MLETAPTPRPFLFLRSSEIGLLKATLKKLVMVPGYTRSDGRFVAAHQKAVHYNPDVLFADVAAGKGSHSQKKAHAKLSNKAWWQNLSVDDQAIAIMALATDIQDAASNSAAVSGWKASASAGKNPTKKEWAAFYALPKDKQAALHDHVQGAAGGLGHLHAPSLPVSPEKAAAIEQDAAPAETPPAGHISFAGSNNTSYHVNAISGGKFSVSVKDDDSGETLPTMTIFPTLDGAIANAKALSEKSKAAGAASTAAPAAGPQAAPPKAGVLLAEWIASGKAYKDDPENGKVAPETAEQAMGRRIKDFEGAGEYKWINDLGVSQHDYEIQNVPLSKLIVKQAAEHTDKESYEELSLIHI